MTSVLLVVALVGLFLFVFGMQKRFVWIGRLARKLLITYVTLVLMFGAAEAYFRFFFAQSENMISLATMNWLERYWRMNELGYRDRELEGVSWHNKRTVLVTGDSFTAGWGIKDPSDRYTDVLARLLGDDYAVFNLGVYGTATPEHLESLKSYPVNKPDIVVMQYFINDINSVMLDMKMLPEMRHSPAWANESYFLNFMYKRLISLYVDPKFNYDWWEENYAAYDNPIAWKAHRAEIEAYIAYVDSIGARLVVVIFPNLLDPERSNKYTRQVARVFRESGHNDILDVTGALKAWKPSDRIVSKRDTHPSIALHQYVGKTLYQQYFTARVGR